MTTARSSFEQFREKANQIARVILNANLKLAPRLGPAHLSCGPVLEGHVSDSVRVQIKPSYRIHQALLMVREREELMPWYTQRGRDLGRPSIMRATLASTAWDLWTKMARSRHVERSRESISKMIWHSESMKTSG